MDPFTKDSRSFPYEYNAQREVEFYPAPPADSNRLTGDILEIGPGLGHLLLTMAESSPDKRFLAIESQQKRFNRIAEKAAKLRVKNITVMKGYAQAVIPLWLQSGVFERVYVLFPDPWPKTRHARNRLLTPDFISMLACLLKVGGELFMATDHAGYARWIIDAAAEVSSINNTGDPFCHQADVADYIPTIFEQKWRRQGKPIAYMKFIRNENNPCSRLGNS